MTIKVRVRRKSDRGHLQLWYQCPLTGKRLTKSAGTDDKDLAARRALEWEIELAGQAIVQNPTWREFRKRFEDEYLLNKPKNTCLSYTSALNNWERHIGQVRSLSLITPSLVSQFAAKFSATVKSTATVAKNLRHLRAALRWAESMEMIKRAPRFVLPKVNKRRLARSRSITNDEYVALRKAVVAIRPANEVANWQRLIDLLWYSGLRIGEALELSWDSPPLRVDMDSSQFPQIVIFAEGQKSTTDELCVIPPDFADWLGKTPTKERTGKVASGLSQFSRSAASHVIANCGEHAKIVTAPGKFASAHDIRRSFGQRWAKKVSQYALQKIMRHESIQTTLSYYVEHGPADVGSELWGVVHTVVHKDATAPSQHKKRTRRFTEKNK